MTIIGRFSLDGEWGVASRATKFRTTKIISGGQVLLFTKICTPENYSLYSNTKLYGSYKVGFSITPPLSVLEDLILNPEVVYGYMHTKKQNCIF